MAWQHGPGCLQQAACISLRHDLHFQPRQVLPPTSSTCTDFLCKIEQLNGLNKSDDKTLIAIFLPPSLKRAICRHLERYFIKQKRKQFRKFLVNLPPESCGARLGGFDQLGSRGLTAPPLGVHGDGKPLASSWPVPGRESWWGEGRGNLRPRFQSNGCLQITEGTCLMAQGLPSMVLYISTLSLIFHS